jgi:hypothetical protein
MKRSLKLKLGLQPLAADPKDFYFERYRFKANLPTHPAAFGHENLVKSWGMLGNDQYGDCVLAGAAHETMLWNAMAKKAVSFTPRAVLSDYSAITGFDPRDPSTDQGTDMRAAAKYRQKTGVVDAKGKRHKIGAYVFLDPQNLEQLTEALWLFGAVALGVQMPQSAMDQFNQGQPWDVVKGSPIEGGHYVPAVSLRGNINVVTWGKVQPVTQAFLKKYATSAIAYLSEEMLLNGKSLEGFDLATLKADLASL